MSRDNIWHNTLTATDYIWRNTKEKCKKSYNNEPKRDEHNSKTFGKKLAIIIAEYNAQSCNQSLALAIIPWTTTTKQLWHLTLNCNYHCKIGVYLTLSAQQWITSLAAQDDVSEKKWKIKNQIRRPRLFKRLRLT